MGWRPGPAGEEREPHINFQLCCHRPISAIFCGKVGLRGTGPMHNAGRPWRAAARVRVAFDTAFGIVLTELTADVL